MRKPCSKAGRKQRHHVTAHRTVVKHSELRHITLLAAFEQVPNTPFLSVLIDNGVTKSPVNPVQTVMHKTCLLLP